MAGDIAAREEFFKDNLPTGTMVEDNRFFQWRKRLCRRHTDCSAMGSR